MEWNTTREKGDISSITFQSTFHIFDSFIVLKNVVRFRHVVNSLNYVGNFTVVFIVWSFYSVCDFMSTISSTNHNKCFSKYKTWQAYFPQLTKIINTTTTITTITQKKRIANKLHSFENAELCTIETMDRLKMSWYCAFQEFPFHKFSYSLNHSLT